VALPLVSGIAIDASNVYWLEGNVMKVALVGGAPVILSLGSPGTPAAGISSLIAVDATSVYWAVQTPPLNFSILKTAK